jgi:hypothetical protein
MVDPLPRLPGIYLARVVATLSNNVINEISPDARGSEPLVGSPLGQHDAEKLNSPCDNCDVNFDKKSSHRETGSGERQHITI